MSKHDPKLTNDIIEGGKKYPFSQYKNDIIGGCENCITTMISRAAVWNNFSHIVPKFYVAPLVCKLRLKDKPKATKQFKARHSFACSRLPDLFFKKRQTFSENRPKKCWKKPNTQVKMAKKESNPSLDKAKFIIQFASSQLSHIKIHLLYSQCLHKRWLSQNYFQN